jgi:cytidylate kinase
MTQLENLERYLRVRTALPRGRVGKPSSEHKPFITISRQAGAGGHHLANALLEVFAEQADRELFGGWQIFDRRLCEMVADDPFYSGSLDSLVAEDYRTRSDEFFHQILRSTVDQRAVMERVFRVVRAVASVGKAIIIGRAGAEVTRDMSHGIDVRLIAPETVRIKGMMDYYGLGESKAREEASRLDQARARLIKTHFKADISDPALYDVVFNTATVPFEAAAAALTTIVSREAEDARVQSLK